MAATKTTYNKLQNLRNVLYWAAQAQGKCPVCKEQLVNGKRKDVDDITFDHASGTYDHNKRKDKVKCKGGIFMHKTCHKSKTMKELKTWEKRKTLKAS